MSYIFDLQFIQLSRHAFKLTEMFEMEHIPAMILNSKTGSMLYYVQEMTLLQVGGIELDIHHFLYDTGLNDLKTIINPKLFEHMEYIKSHFGVDPIETID